MKKSLLAGLILGAFQLSAANLVVPNGSFETATLPINPGWGTYSNLVPGTSPTGGTVANWTAINTTPGNNIGAYDPDLGYPNWSFTWEDGNNMGFAQSFGAGANNAGLSQILPYILTADTTYTLGSLVGRRQFTPGVWNYSIELWAGGVQLGSAANLVLATDAAGSDSLIVNIGSAHAQLGQALEIRLMTNGFGTEAFFDRVTLDASPTPEPATWAMMGTGLGLAFIGARRRKVVAARG
jgi:hypothetical protein